MSTAAATDPIVKTLTLDAPADKAFRHFTANIHLWWPLATHSLSLENAKTVVFEAIEGGRVYEIDKSGNQREWGRVKLCEPPRRLVFSWVLEAPEKQTEVEATFDDAGNGKSTLTLIHRGWDKRSDGAEWRGKYDQGWDGVLDSYKEELSN